VVTPPLRFLADAPSGRHIAQFHREPDALVESVFAFLEAGLRRDNSLLIIASADQVDRLFDRLSVSRFQPQSLRISGQLAVLDSTRLLEHVAVSERPEATEFQRAVVPALMRLQPSGRGVRVYSAIANTLWETGNTDLAIRLEDSWNTLAGSHPFSLYCAFTMDTQSENSYAAPLEELGRTHSDILGTTEDEQFGVALDRASKEIFGVPLTQMAGVTRQDGARRFPSGQRAMLWVKRNLPMSTGPLAERARHYFKDTHA
jgi:hypothetical protein